ncbi:hypothetical protein VMT65_14995 [Nocardia sp. CDC153]|uniref:hypothetical protein n=1 Tax=Nocardia sp. CDC153 TaxID=3112167 RepID=UPI002DBD55A1|nr:hypothetical protein [Nocardia sp. CDC153]MEC3954345.1 hypothetical protein [Nocardia sp. CDC153]
MGYYTHGWAESQRDISDVVAAAKAAKAARRGRGVSDESVATRAGQSAHYATGGRATGRRDYGEAIIQTGAALLGPTPVPGIVVGGIWGAIKGFFDNL